MVWCIRLGTVLEVWSMDMVLCMVMVPEIVWYMVWCTWMGTKTLVKATMNWYGACDWYGAWILKKFFGWLVRCFYTSRSRDKVAFSPDFDQRDCHATQCASLSRRICWFHISFSSTLLYTMFISFIHVLGGSRVDWSSRTSIRKPWRNPWPSNRSWPVVPVSST